MEQRCDKCDSVTIVSIRGLCPVCCDATITQLTADLKTVRGERFDMEEAYLKAKKEIRRLTEALNESEFELRRVARDLELSLKSAAAGDAWTAMEKALREIAKPTEAMGSVAESMLTLFRMKARTALAAVDARRGGGEGER